VYISFDIDALDPSAAPGTGTPVIGGPSTDFVRKLLQGLRGINVVAADMVEVLPDKDPSNITAIAAATLTQDIMYLMMGE
ncbi:MAG TPA: agmatinase, partial [Clostridiales bacterium UBA9856]|nr:agmatinase [Clostridiales bacterium UBA9856]